MRISLGHRRITTCRCAPPDAPGERQCVEWRSIVRCHTQRYLEHLCDTLVASCCRSTDMIGRGVEPFGFGAELRFSPTRTKAVMRELLQHHLLDIQVVVGSDGRNELRMTWNRETERWYERILRFRIAHRKYAECPVPDRRAS